MRDYKKPTKYFPEKPVELILVKDIVYHHNKFISIYGGIPGTAYNTVGILEGIISQVQYYGGVRYRSIPSLAAYLFYLIAKGHAFPDGNKRAAIGALGVFLEINGYSLEVKWEVLVNFAEKVASSDPQDMNDTIKKSANWIRRNIVIAK